MYKTTLSLFPILGKKNTSWESSYFQGKWKCDVLWSSSEHFSPPQSSFILLNVVRSEANGK